MKTLFAWSYGAATGLGLTSTDGAIQVHDALRFPAWCFAGLSVALTFLLARTLLPRRAALLAAALWFSLPHPFWHMHVACFDVGVTAAHTWLVLAYLRG
jgi:4-amino-4-deoxy-L-arabinose transferase-like glycosyltransferase